MKHKGPRGLFQTKYILNIFLQKVLLLEKDQISKTSYVRIGLCSLSANCGFITLSISWKIQSLKCQQMIFPLILGERPTLFSDIWSLSAVLLQWLLESPPWDFQDLCARYQYRENKHVSISSKWAKRNEAKHERKYWFRYMIANKFILWIQNTS